MSLISKSERHNILFINVGGHKDLHFCMYVQPKIVCCQLLRPLMDFVLTHTQWPTYEDDCKDRIMRSCKFYTSYGTLSWGAPCPTDTFL